MRKGVKYKENAMTYHMTPRSIYKKEIEIEN